jgi:hypothetical protein
MDSVRRGNSQSVEGRQAVFPRARFPVPKDEKLQKLGTRVEKSWDFNMLEGVKRQIPCFSLIFSLTLFRKS